MTEQWTTVTHASGFAVGAVMGLDDRQVVSEFRTLFLAEHIRKTHEILTIVQAINTRHLYLNRLLSNYY